MYDLLIGNTKKALINRKGLININKSSLSQSSSDNIFIYQNLTPMNNKIVFHCRKLKRNGQIDKIYSRDGVIYIASCNIRDGKVIKILHMSMLLDIFSDFDFGPDAGEEEHNESLQSSYRIQVCDNFVNFVVFFWITWQECPGLPQCLGWSYL